MRKLILSEFSSLDGVVEAPETWQMAYISEDMGENIMHNILSSDVALMGRVTYDIFAGSWPQMTNNEFGIADHLNNQPKYVVSSTLQKADWNNTTILRGSPEEQVAKLKEQPGGDIGMTGSATLARALLKAGLVDVVRLYIHPIVLGGGMRLFEDNASKIPLKLVDLKQFKSGVTLMDYQPE